MDDDTDIGALESQRDTRRPGQLLKWVGSKHADAQTIIDHFPFEYNTYYEPFLGTGGVLGNLAPPEAVAGDTLEPLIDLWKLVKNDPDTVIDHYRDTAEEMMQGNKEEIYERIKQSYNEEPDPLDLLMISRTCYGAVIRFTKGGAISTPVGPHNPMNPDTFEKRCREWHEIVQNVEFYNQSFEETLDTVSEDDLVYLDPPYVLSQDMLYGAHDFSVEKLWREIRRCKNEGAYVALSIDGAKKSGEVEVDVDIPEDLFEREVLIEKGRSMLRRFQMENQEMVGEGVQDRLLLGYWLGTIDLDINALGSALSNPTRVRLLRLLSEDDFTASRAHEEYISRFDDEKYRESIYRELENLVDWDLVSKEYATAEKELLYSIQHRRIEIDVTTSEIDVIE